MLASWMEEFDAASDTAFVAERGGELLGSTALRAAAAGARHTRGCRAAGVRRRCVPAARGQGVGLAMAEHSFAWAREAGYGTIVTDWRAPNLLASRFWPRRGFRPTFHRLHRMTMIG